MPFGSMRLNVAMAITLVLVAVRVQGGGSRGAVLLDSLTFDKILEATANAHVLVKVDKQYPYGEWEDAYKGFLDDVVDTPLIVGEVGVQDYANMDNDDIRERFGIDPDEFPVFLLFKAGSGSGAMPVRYEGAESVSELKRFVTAETAIWIGLKGTLEKFDKIAQDFTAGAVSLDAAKARMGTELEALQDEDSQNTAKIYTIVMDRIGKKADGATDPVDAAKALIESETSRVGGLMKGKISESKKASLETRLNILASFFAPTKDKDEL